MNSIFKNNQKTIEVDLSEKPNSIIYIYIYILQIIKKKMEVELTHMVGNWTGTQNSNKYYTI